MADRGAAAERLATLRLVLIDHQRSPVAPCLTAERSATLD